MSKFIVSIILSVSTIVISSIIFVLEGVIRFGFSDYKLPFDVGAKYVLDKSLPLSQLTSQMKYVSGSQRLIPLWSASIILVLIIIIVSISIASIIMFISTISKNSLISLLTNVLLIGGFAVWYFLGFRGSYIQATKYGPICEFLPVSYMIDNLAILSGDISMRLNDSIGMFFVLMVCLVWTLIMMFLSTYVFAKRDFD